MGEIDCQGIDKTVEAFSKAEGTSIDGDLVEAFTVQAMPRQLQQVQLKEQFMKRLSFV